MIEILSTGAVNSVQDLGRSGFLDVGVGWSGAMDTAAMAAANLLIGNPPNAAGIEVSLFPFRLRFLRDTVFALTGADCPVTLGDRSLPSWWAETARAGETLTLGLPRAGARAYLAMGGGLNVPEVLGSRATDLKSGFGGWQGRGLNRGDRLPLVVGGALPEGGIGIDPTTLRDGGAPTESPVVLRVLPSAEYLAFTDTALETFFSTAWIVTNEANRMGYRLSGPDLALTRKLELFSHGIMPGTVQVPPSGQPIIQLAEANTCGGYPKIANVIEADLWRLAQAPVGATLRFALVDRAEAVAALVRQRRALDDIATLASLARKDRQSERRQTSNHMSGV
ncbi:5-oxoprolinase subunit C family protein [Mycoplana ramosa]|uniref:Biotin-dependent carboxyltransferase family protein n=1 Tax=Mycoplana ramosa TaxID=40837 RepID=A0ABW3Z179_MYCRA